MNAARISEPRQERSRLTRERICEATLSLLAERPFASISVDDIVVRAGCSTSSFYARFSSKIGVLHHLQDRVVAVGEELIALLDSPAAECFVKPIPLGTAILCRYMAFRREHAVLLRALRAHETQDDRIRCAREQLDRNAYAAIKRALLRVLGARPGGRLDTTLERTMWIFAASARAAVDDPHHDAVEDPERVCAEAVGILVSAAMPAFLDDSVVEH